MTYALLIPAAGRGERFGGSVSKALTMLEGRPLIWWALSAFAEDQRLLEVVVATAQELTDEFEHALTGHPLEALLKFTVGGETRQDSVGKAIDAITVAPDHVLVHDAARPLVSRDVIMRVLDGLVAHEAAVPGIPVVDTLKLVANGLVTATLNRRELFAVQTPQGVRTESLRAAHVLARKSGVQCTDDVALIEHFGLGSVALVPGDPANLKITVPQDLLRASAILGTNSSS